MQKIKMQPSQLYRSNHAISQLRMQAQMRNEPVKKTGTFFISNHNINGQSMKMLHLQPNFVRKPNMYSYEISGSDGFKLDGVNHINKVENNPVLILSFNCKTGKIYFCKIIAYYSKGHTAGSQTPEYDTDEYRLFYKVSDDFDEDDEGEGEEEEEKEKESDNDEGTELEEVSDNEDISDTEISTIKEYMFSQNSGTGLDLNTDKEEA